MTPEVIAALEGGHFDILFVYQLNKSGLREAQTLHHFFEHILQSFLQT